MGEKFIISINIDKDVWRESRILMAKKDYRSLSAYIEDVLKQKIEEEHQ